MKGAIALPIGIMLVVTCNAYGQPASEVTWTAETQQLVANGDPAKGKVLAQKKCARCHADDGTGADEALPSLAGQLAAYTYKQLRDFQSGARENPAKRVLRKLSAQDLADLAAWYASSRPDSPAAQQRSGLMVVVKAAYKSWIAACDSCHGANGKGMPIDSPALAGQSAEYFITTMQDYKEGLRTNDAHSRMRVIAAALAERQIEELANYYASLPSRESMARMQGMD